MSGHYFCNRCDDVAHGRVCRACGFLAVWIADQAPAAVTQPRSQRRNQPVSLERGRQLFAEIHARLGN